MLQHALTPSGIIVYNAESVVKKISYFMSSFKNGTNRYPLTRWVNHQYAQRCACCSHHCIRRLFSEVETTLLHTGTNSAQQMGSGDMQLHFPIVVTRWSHCYTPCTPGQTSTAMAATRQHQLHRLALLDANKSWRRCCSG
jgi:hypothetical protein